MSIDVIQLSKMSKKEMTTAIRNMTEEEVEALLTLVEKLIDRRSEIENYLLDM